MNDLKCFLNFLFGDNYLWKSFKELLSDDHIRCEDHFLPDSIDGDYQNIMKTYEDYLNFYREKIVEMKLYEEFPILEKTFNID
jgi:hypothetical protein